MASLFRASRRCDHSAPFECRRALRVLCAHKQTNQYNIYLSLSLSLSLYISLYPYISIPLSLSLSMYIYIYIHTHIYVYTRPPPATRAWPGLLPCGRPEAIPAPALPAPSRIAILGSAPPSGLGRGIVRAPGRSTGIPDSLPRRDERTPAHPRAIFATTQNLPNEVILQILCECNAVCRVDADLLLSAEICAKKTLPDLLSETTTRIAVIARVSLTARPQTHAPRRVGALRLSRGHTRVPRAG